MYKLLVLTASFVPLVVAESVPMPKVTPLPVTAASRPFLSATNLLTPLDLSKTGYVEEEFMVTGAANVYDWPADGKLVVKTPGVPYGTRILVRHPADPARFSGTAIVELPNTARRNDWPMMWGFSMDYFMDHGDAWVAVTLPAASAGLKKFNPTRYADMSYASPGGSCGANNQPADFEDGLKWDALSQIAVALKGKAVLPTFNVQRVFMTTQGADIVTYVNAIEPASKAYDGFMIKGPAAPSKINSCAQAIPRGDARVPVHDVGVPVIQVVPQGEVADAAANRRADGDFYRLYEISGATHIDKYAYRGMASVADQNATGSAAQGTPDWPFNARCEPEIMMSTHPMLVYSFDMAFANLDAWARGTAAPKAPRMAIKDGAIDRDEFGNGKGGVRNVYVDVPTASYFNTTPGPGTCRELGYETGYDWKRLESLYGSYSNYAKKLNASVDQLVKDHWLTESDAKKIRVSAVTPK